MTSVVGNEAIENVADEAMGETRPSSPPRVLSALGLFLALISLADLAFHTSRDPVLFGRYSLSLFGGILCAVIFCLIWVWSIVSPRPAEILGVLLTLYKESPFHGIIVLGLFSFLIWFFGRWTKFEEFRLIQIATIGYCISGIIAILFPLVGKGRVWRTIATLFFVSIIAVELVLQVMSYTGNLDLNTSRGLSAPFGRIYLNEEWHGANAITNRHGWYAPPFSTDSDNERVIIIGDGFIEGTQVSIQETIGVNLDIDMGESTDVLAMGTAGFGPAQYYETTLSALNEFNPDTIFIAINLGDDFLNVLQDQDPRRAQDHIFYILNEDGSISIEENSLIAQHFTDHYLNNSTLPLWDTAIHTLRSHLLLPKVTEPIRNFARMTPIQEAVSRERWAEIDAGYTLRGFIFDETETELTSESTALLTALLDLSISAAEAQNVTIALIGIPPADTSLNTDRPNNILADFADERGVYYLPLEADPELYTSLYGHWNHAGHRYYGEIIIDCWDKPGEGACPGR